MRRVRGEVAADVRVIVSRAHSRGPGGALREGLALGAEGGQRIGILSSSPSDVAPKGVGIPASHLSRIIPGSGYALDSGSPLYLVATAAPAAGAFHDVAVGDRFRRDGLLDEAEEELPAVARPAAVESKRELVQVLVQMGLGDGPLMRTQQPALEQ